MKIAIIDLGTNTFNLLIAKTLPNKTFKTLLLDKVGVKLGKGGINKKTITSEAFNRGINAIEQINNTIQNNNVDKIIATATSGIRSTQNGKELVQVIENKFDIKIQIIDGNKEAEFIYAGVKQACKLNTDNILILDIGGGSNEFIIANNKTIKWKHSFDLGMARLLDKFEPSDPITVKEISKIEKYLEKQLELLFNAVEAYKPKVLIGSSGTFDSFRAMLISNTNYIEGFGDTSYKIDIEKYEKLHSKLLSSTHSERMKMKGLEPVRVDMIVLASIFVNFTLKKFQLSDFYQSNYAIKEGVIAEFLDTKSIIIQ
ncbi:MAG: phosphatase [Bacteroidota bacterium]|nr:phosphatase [Bacteroidota bacterium]